MAEITRPGPIDRYILRGSGPFAIAMPARPLRSVPIGEGAALWLGPDEFLLLLAAGEGAAVAGRLAVCEAAMSLVDVSHRQMAFRLAGDDAAGLLNGAVPLDLAAAAFPTGACTRTVFDKAEIVLWRYRADAFHIEVARTYAPYLRDLLGVIAASNGLALTGDA